MIRSRQGGIAGVATLALILGLTSTAQAQGSAATTEAATMRVGTSAATDALRREAAALYSSPEEWDRVIQLRSYAASLASPDDPLRVEDLWMAGSVSAALGRFGDAELYLDEAATAALAQGNVARAGQGWVAACIVAIHRGSLDSATALLTKAGRMAHAPGMPREILAIIEPEIAQLADKLAALKAHITD